MQYIFISPRVHGSSCWPTQPLSGTSIFKQLSLRPQKMDIDLEPWLNGLNYRVVLVAGQQRKRDKREEEQRNEMKIEKDKGEGQKEWGRLVELSKILVLQMGSLFFCAFCNHPYMPNAWASFQSSCIYLPIGFKESEDFLFGLLKRKKKGWTILNVKQNNPAESVDLSKSGWPSVSQPCLAQTVYQSAALLKPPWCTALLMGPGAAGNRFVRASPVVSDSPDINKLTCDKNINEVSVSHAATMKTPVRNVYFWCSVHRHTTED